MTAIFVSNNKRSTNLSLHTSSSSSNSTGELASNTRFELSPNGSETENEPRSSINNQPKSGTMSNSDDLILNTNFDFHAPAFSSHHLQDDSKRAHKRVVTDHVLENGERVVVVDPNVSEGEDNNEDEEQKPESSQNSQLSPLDKAISSLFAVASNNQQSQRKRSNTPTPKTVSGILAAKRRKVEKPQKRASEPDFASTLNDSLLASTSFLSALTSTPSTSSHQKTIGSRPSSSNSDLGTSKSSLSDSGIVSADEQAIVTPKQQQRQQSNKQSKLGLNTNDGSIPAPALQLLINAAGGEDMSNMNLTDLLANDPNLLKSINDAITANPAQQHTLQIVPTETKSKKEVKVEKNPVGRESFFGQESKKTAPQQLNSLLSSWPELLSTASKLDEQSAAKILSGAINNNEESRVDEGDNQEELLRLGSEWLLRELFKGKSIDKPQQPSIQPLRKRKLDAQAPQLKSSESVLSQLKSLKGQKQLAELEELEQFASHFKRQRIKHGFTQGDVGVALGRRYGTDFSQTTISRFEALNLSFKNMCKLRPLMEEWLIEAENAIQRGFTVSDIVEAETLKQDREKLKSADSMDSNSPPGSSTQQIAGQSINSDMSCSAAIMSSLSPSGIVPGLSNVLPTLKKRRKRTNLDNQQRDTLNAYFAINSRPDHQQMSQIAEKLDLDADIVRVWFCNTRQKIRKV